MITLYIILAPLAALLSAVLIRALAFKPEASELTEASKISVNEEKAVRDLSDMIKCQTVSSMDSSAEDEGEFLRFEKLLSERFPSVYEKCALEKPNSRSLLYKWQGKSSENPSVLMAHYDVVSVDEDKWQKPAFEGVIEEGFLYGRGAIDTKCTVNGILQAAEALIKEGFTPERDLYFAFGGNEEISGDGIPSVLKLFRERNITPGFVLDEGGAVLESVFPGVKGKTALIGIAEKGMVNLEYKVQGGGGHSSSPKRNSPIARLARAVSRLEKKPFKFTLTPPAKMLFDKMARRSTFLFRIIFANLWLFAPILNILAKKQGGEMNALMRTTLCFTQMKGSSGMNVIPPEASMVSNSRIIPGETPETVLERVKKTVKDDKVEIRIINSQNPSKVSNTETKVYKNLEKTIEETFFVPVCPYLMEACTDSRHFAEITDKVYRFSPIDLTNEDRATIHGNDERISLSNLKKCVEFYIRLIKNTL